MCENSTVYQGVTKYKIVFFIKNACFWAIRDLPLHLLLKKHSKNTFLTIEKIQKVDTLSYKTKSANKQTVVHEWFVVDAANMSVGRMCTTIADVLRGKHKPSYTPHVDCGDYVVVINADKVRFTGNKMAQKTYLTFSGYPGGQKSATAQELMAKKPTAIVEYAVKGMIPKNKLGRAIIKKLFVYAGEEHPHAAQKPQPLTINK